MVVSQRFVASKRAKRRSRNPIKVTSKKLVFQNPFRKVVYGKPFESSLKSHLNLAQGVQSVEKQEEQQDIQRQIQRYNAGILSAKERALKELAQQEKERKAIALITKLNGAKGLNLSANEIQKIASSMVRTKEEEERQRSGAMERDVKSYFNDLTNTMPSPLPISYQRPQTFGAPENQQEILARLWDLYKAQKKGIVTPTEIAMDFDAQAKYDAANPKHNIPSAYDDYGWRQFLALHGYDANGNRIQPGQRNVIPPPPPTEPAPPIPPSESASMIPEDLSYVTTEPIPVPLEPLSIPQKPTQQLQDLSEVLYPDVFYPTPKPKPTQQHPDVAEVLYPTQKPKQEQQETIIDPWELYRQQHTSAPFSAADSVVDPYLRNLVRNLEQIDPHADKGLTNAFLQEANEILVRSNKQLNTDLADLQEHTPLDKQDGIAYAFKRRNLEETNTKTRNKDLQKLYDEYAKTAIKDAKAMKPKDEKSFIARAWDNLYSIITGQQTKPKGSGQLAATMYALGERPKGIDPLFKRVHPKYRTPDKSEFEEMMENKELRDAKLKLFRKAYENKFYHDYVEAPSRERVEEAFPNLVEIRSIGGKSGVTKNGFGTVHLHRYKFI